MKILVLTSRYTANRDIIGEDFGRQTRLFEALRKFEHEIYFFCADYRMLESKNITLHGINVVIRPIRPFNPYYILKFAYNLNNLISKEKFDLVVSTSDPVWGMFGFIFSRIHKITFLYDLHDNYEMYGTYKIPFFKYLDRFIIKKADILTTVSYSLKNKIKKLRKKKVFVIQNGVDTNLFRPMGKLVCRNMLKLPKEAKIIAYTGSIQRSQGVDLLIDAFNKLNKEIKNIKLVIAGRFVGKEESKINLRYDGVIYLKSLAQDKIVRLINAADVCVVPNRENDFTKYCFPYKIVEYMACNTPIVATKLGDVNSILRCYKDSLCLPDNTHDMYKKIKAQLKKGKINYRKNLKSNTWDNIALELHNIISKK